MNISSALFIFGAFVFVTWVGLTIGDRIGCYMVATVPAAINVVMACVACYALVTIVDMLITRWQHRR